ncbi:N-formylglutamate amidohydrolase [Nocardioides sp. TF02-7]|uniref:N-formylglutamate amidohydrolase n=1 Tax=Nocardioides sp. TF02-7 TaxID=2917724 RepID=UPI001F067538|nr:N-formylglutamate amidohydrolase [Nocardioides sp. TF02-7]UMG93557.1 N-formylglutamate amidohydrolase [Nocardioides sp. TF02-7]
MQALRRALDRGLLTEEQTSLFLDRVLDFEGAGNASARVRVGALTSPVVLHVPHASTYVSPDARRSIMLDHEELAVELAHMTDLHTDAMAEAVAATTSGAEPWLFVNERSRLVVDPERFTDEREEMRAVGMGAVYTRTSHGRVLREPDPAGEAWLVERYFAPYATALADLVDERLAVAGRAVIIDLHSYPSQPLPYELHGDQRRPEVCLGVDEQHTPAWLLEAAERAFASYDVVVDEPFAGTYVPSRHHRRDLRVASLMVEVRRDVYMREPGSATHDGLEALVSAIVALVGGVSG